jgi:hypothetical protein
MPESFVESAQLSMVTCLNDPQVCDALDAVDPDTPDAMESYAKIFASAIPGFPLLTESEMVRVAEAIRLAAKLTDEIKPNEIFAFFCRICALALEIVLLLEFVHGVF